MMNGKYMRRAIELAMLGLGDVSPNPMVGCVIVHKDKIIGEGYHMIYGGPHAEVNAINSVKDQTLLPESDVYVSLEPCAHHGKTPPCADLLAHHKVKQVYISNIDPNPLVGGNGIKILQEAGVEVSSDVLKDEGEKLNRRFFTFIKHKRPYIILKWAQTADRYIARKNFDSKWISSKFSRKLVHKWRSEEDAILVGKNTAHHDNPSLNVRDWEGSDPLRIVVDHHLELSSHLNLFDHTIPTICYNQRQSSEAENLSFVKLDAQSFLEEMMDDLCHRKVQSLIVEGGAATLQSFIDKGLWDEARVFESRATFGDGIVAPQLKDAALLGREDLQGDTVTLFERHK